VIEKLLKELTKAKRGGQLTKEEAQGKLLAAVKGAVREVEQTVPEPEDRTPGRQPIQIRTSRLRRLMAVRGTKVTIPLHELIAKERRARGRQAPRP